MSDLEADTSMQAPANSAEDCASLGHNGGPPLNEAHRPGKQPELKRGLGRREKFRLLDVRVSPNQFCETHAFVLDDFKPR